MPDRTDKQWSKEKANEWYDRRPWIVGCNFIPSTIVNWTEMWQAEAFDPETISRELALAASIGYNTVRSFFQQLVWQDNPAGFKERLDQFLALAKKHGIAVMPVFFDDCVIGQLGTEPMLGKQPGPVFGRMFSSWTPSPGHKRAVDPAVLPKLEEYVKDVIDSFADDERILMWDLYNEVSAAHSLPLLKASYEWARAARPSQPITACISGSPEMIEIETTQSDIITFHSCSPAAELEKQIADLRKHERPLVCTEWMARGRGSLVTTNFPVFQRENVGAINWGFVNGRSMTQFPWEADGTWDEPGLWFHDLFRGDGSPYSQQEIDLIRKLTAEAGTR